MLQKTKTAFFVQDLAAYIQLHPLRIIAGLIIVFAILLISFFRFKKGIKKWITLGLIGVFLPLAFRIVRLTPIKKIQIFKTENTFENTDLSSFEKNGIRTFGLDVSHHQGDIDWDSVATSKHPIQFVFIRATYGAHRLDRNFDYNWDACRHRSFLRGVYHYYRPHQSSISQFEFFKKHVHLRKGDLPPVLDLEENSLFGKANLISGVKNWLKLAKEHYGVQAIIYTNRDFYLRYFNNKDFKSYHFWIAAYSGRHRVATIPWTFHQFTEGIYVKGIEGNVDGNDFNGDRKALEKLIIR